MIAGKKCHKDILKLTDKYVKEQIKESLHLNQSLYQKFLGLFKDNKTK